MCVKNMKALNPEAQEWLPTPPAPPLPLPPLLPHALIRPHLSSAPPPPPQLVVAFTAAPPILTYYTPQPVYTIDFPAKTTAATAPPLFEKNAEPPQHAIPSDEEQKAVKRRESPRVDASNKTAKRYVPPRLRRVFRSRTKASPPPTKQEWRPKIAAKVLGDGGAAESPPLSKTTLMIKNVPNTLRRESMLNFLDGFCKTHSLEYDFLYLPFDFSRLGNFGYAFVNFTTTAAAMKMMEILSHYKWRRTVQSSKVCEMTWARIQGKEALLRRFQNASFKCNDAEFLPVLLDPPRNGSDPNPPPPVTLGKLCRPLSL